MGRHDSQISFCPKCGSKLVCVGKGIDNDGMYLCTGTACNIAINGNTISYNNTALYAKYNEIILRAREHSNTFMLLKENLSGPMLQKLTNTALEKDKSMYCIVQADSIEDALKKFQRKFNVIKVTNDMVIPITIKED